MQRANSPRLPDWFEYFEPPLKGEVSVEIMLGEQDEDGWFMPTVLIPEGTQVLLLGQFESEDYDTNKAYIVFYDHELLSVDSGLIETEYSEKLPLPTNLLRVYND